jgi:hypothetical protein
VPGRGASTTGGLPPSTPTLVMTNIARDFFPVQLHGPWTEGPGIQKSLRARSSLLCPSLLGWNRDSPHTLVPRVLLRDCRDGEARDPLLTSAVNLYI